MRLLRTILITLIFGGTALLSSGAGATTSFTFDGPDAEGWGVLDYLNGRIFSGDPAGPAGLTVVGNPAATDPTDAILADDPNADEGARFLAPAPFTGDASALSGATLSFDLTVAINFNPNSYSLGRALGLVYIESGNEGLIYTDVLPDGGWTRYSLVIGPNAAPLTLSPEPNLGGLPIPDVGFWAYIPDIANIGAAFADPTQQNFDDILGAVDRFTIVGEVLDGPDDSLALDNVNLSVVPVPAALPLIVSGLIALGASSRRRSA